MSPVQLADLYNKHCESQTDMKFAQHPSTWLNAKGYLDKPMSKKNNDEFNYETFCGYYAVKYNGGPFIFD